MNLADVFIMDKPQWLSYWDENRIYDHDCLGFCTSIHDEVVIPDNIEMFVNHVQFIYDCRCQTCWTFKLKTLEEVQAKLLDLKVLFCVLRHESGVYLVRGMKELI